MVDFIKQMKYWLSSSQEDWLVAKELVQGKHVRHGLFFAHLALEKPQSCPLAELTGLALTQDQTDLLAEANEFNIQGRYPDALSPVPDQKEALNYLSRIEELLKWLTAKSELS